jgi:hypothetical protein
MKQEDLLYSLLKEYFPGEEIIREYTFSNKLRLDFYLPELNLGIEYNGVQHDRYVSFYHKSKSDLYLQQNRDEQKEYVCSQLGINLIKFDWKDNLTIELVKERFLSPGSGIVTEEGEQYLNKKVALSQSKREVRKKSYKNYKSSEAYQVQKARAKEWRKKRAKELKEIKST